MKNTQRPEIHVFVAALRVEEVRINLEKVCGLFPVFFIRLFRIFQTQFENIEITLLNDLFRPVSRVLARIKHLKVRMVERLFAPKPLVYDVYQEDVGVSITRCDEEIVMHVKEVSNR